MPASLVCFEPSCRTTFPITEVLYNCPVCGGLLEAIYTGEALDPAHWKQVWRERRMTNAPARSERRMALSGVVPFPRLTRIPCGHAARGQHAPADRPETPPHTAGWINHIQASGIQSDRIVQRQRHDLRRRPGRAAGDEARCLRLHRQHLRIHGRLCQRRPDSSRSSSSRTAISHTANSRRRWSTARARFRSTPISIRFWHWCACSPTGSAFTC